MRIGLLGFGVVGRGVYEIIGKRKDMQVAAVLCLEDVVLPDAKVTRDYQEILNDATIDTVVEAMGGLHPSYEFVRDAILAGKNIITSNKALIAAYYDELLPLCRENHVLLRCTAAVGGGIGWLSELERARKVQTVTQVGGIMNGTCNYILDAMTRRGLSYQEALTQAQSLGYAERDPSTDVDGIDTWHKLLISCNVAFGVSMDRESVPVAGIRNVRAEDIRSFTEHGLVCKLVSTGKQTEDGLCAYVQPALFPVGQPESAVPLNYNLITFIGSASERMSFYGQGAGRYPTAYNVVQDCVAVAAGDGFYAPYGEKTKAENGEKMRYYVSICTQGLPEENAEARWGDGVVTKPVSVGAMHAWLADHKNAFIAALPYDA